ncbi:MAG TPA: SDR family oxidoreductase, partial [Bacillota bacterium]
ALNLLTRTFAIELGPYGIRVNAVSPGLVRDEVLGPDNPPRNEYDRAVLSGIPLGRTASPEDVAEAVLFLADDRRAAFVTGAFLSVTGGADAGRTHLPSSRALRRM